jgi:hypothetical protein
MKGFRESGKIKVLQFASRQGLSLRFPPATKSVTDSIRDSTPPMPHKGIGQLPTANRWLFLLAAIVLLAASLGVYDLAQRSL